jgi:hypothetical protein
MKGDEGRKQKEEEYRWHDKSSMATDSSNMGLASGLTTTVETKGNYEKLSMGTP